MLLNRSKEVSTRFLFIGNARKEKYTSITAGFTSRNLYQGADMRETRQNK